MTENNEKLLLSIIIPEQVVFSGEVDMAILPGTDGEFGVLHGHISFLTSLNQGIIKVHNDNGKITKYFVNGGFTEVNEASTTVLTDFAVNLATVKPEEYKSKIKALEEKISNGEEDEFIKDELSNLRHVLTLVN